MSDEVPENYERQKSRVSPVEEGLDPSSPPKKRCAKALTSMKKATEEDEFHLEALVKEKGEGDFIVEEVPSTSVVPCLKLIGPEVFNVDTKRELSKELHNLGEGYLRIFQLLEEMQGTLEFKKELVEYTIMEVKRLKAQDLVKQLEERLRTINKKLKKNKSQI
ncbi:sarcoma antigen 1-like [Thomomys bottae]